MGLKDLLARVVNGLTRAAERPAQRPPADEPIPTRSMAELYVRQGHLERAEAILSSLEGGEVAARLREIQRMRARQRLEAALGDSPEEGLNVTREGELLAVTWGVPDAGLQGASRLVANGALALRVVEVFARDGRAERRVRDRAIERRGAEVLEVEPDANVIVAIGLTDGDGFASIAHAKA